MRKLLYLAAGVALLSAPAAFAQNDSTPSNQPSPVMGSTGTNATTGGQTTGSTDAQGNVVRGPAQDAPYDTQTPAAPAPDQAAPPPPSDQSQYSAPNQPAPGYYTQAPGAPAPGQAPPPPSGAYNDQSQIQGPPSGVESKVRANSGSRLYVQNGEYQGQGVQIVSNAPVPDTRAVRRMFPPLSRAGRRTRPAGN